MPKGNEYPTCQRCPRPLKREQERDNGLCVNCFHERETAIGPVTVIPSLHPLFAMVIDVHGMGVA